jgi:hypothetical protein
LNIYAEADFWFKGARPDSRENKKTGSPIPFHRTGKGSRASKLKTVSLSGLLVSIN